VISADPGDTGPDPRQQEVIMNVRIRALIAGAFGAATLAASGLAAADGDRHRGHGWGHGHGKHHHHYYHGRAPYGHGYGYGPVVRERVIVRDRPVYYAPPPVYYGPPAYPVRSYDPAIVLSVQVPPLVIPLR